MLCECCFLSPYPACWVCTVLHGSSQQCHVCRRVTAPPEQCASLFSSRSSQEVGAAPEEVIVAEAAAMKKELARISERLRVLEEQHKAWRKEEPLVYSMLLSACLVNTWLWLWR